MTLFFFLFRSKQRKCHTYPHPLPPTHTPCRKREEINQRAREEKVLKDMSWGSTRDNSALRHRNYAAFLSPASQITVLAPSCLSRTSAPTVPRGGAEDAQVPSGRLHLSLKSTPISPTELPPFVSLGSKDPNQGPSSVPGGDTFSEHSWTQGGNQGNWPQCQLIFKLAW